MNLKIGNILVKNNIILAPMAGISNPSYIKICEEMNLGYAVSELISSEAIIRNNKKTFDMLNGIENLKIPFAIQLFGSNPDTMAQAAKILVDKYKIKIIDINMGCPVAKVALRSNAGSGLLKDKNKVFEIVSKVVKSVNVPVTVKIRAGWDSKSINFIEIGKTIEKAGASAITLHARTREQGYSGKANWNYIKELKENVSIPVIGNGDIKTIYDCKKMLSETKCDAVMIGRACLGNPWLIKQCSEYIYNNNIIEKPSYNDIYNMIIKHYNLLKNNIGEKKAVLEIKIHAFAYLKSIPYTKEIRNEIAISKNEKELFLCIEHLKNHINLLNKK